MNIFKHPLQQTTVLFCQRVLKVAWQHGQICAWTQNETGQDVPHEVVLLPTGFVNFDPTGWDYIDSAVSDQLVFHVYARRMQ